MSQRPHKPAPVVVKRPPEQRRKLPPDLEAFARSDDEKLRIRRPRVDRGLIRDPREGYTVAGVANRDARAVYDVRSVAMRALWDEGAADERALAALGQLFHDALRLELWHARRLTSFAAFAEEVVGVPAERAEALADEAALRMGEPVTPLTEVAIALWLRTEAGLYEGDEGGRARVRSGERGLVLEIRVDLDEASTALAGVGARHLPLARSQPSRDERSRDERGRDERGRDERGRDERGRERAHEVPRAPERAARAVYADAADYDEPLAEPLASEPPFSARAEQEHDASHDERGLPEGQLSDDSEGAADLEDADDEASLDLEAADDVEASDDEASDEEASFDRAAADDVEASDDDASDDDASDDGSDDDASDDGSDDEGSDDDANHDAALVVRAPGVPSAGPAVGGARLLTRKPNSARGADEQPVASAPAEHWGRREQRDERPRFGGSDRGGSPRPERPRFGGGDRDAGGDRPAFGQPRGAGGGGERPRFGGQDRGAGGGGERPRFGGQDRGAGGGGDRPRFGGQDRGAGGGGDRPRFGQDKPARSLGGFTTGPSTPAQGAGKPPAGKGFGARQSFSGGAPSPRAVVTKPSPRRDGDSDE